MLNYIRYVNINLALSDAQYVSFCALKDFIFLCLAGEEDGNREAGESEVDGQAEKNRHAAAGPDEWDGPSKQNFHISFLEGL